jgi:hypothetical protein
MGERWQFGARSRAVVLARVARSTIDDGSGWRVPTTLAAPSTEILTAMGKFNPT